MIRIVHLYPDLLNIYGGRADLRLLKMRLAASGEEVRIDEYNAGEAPSLEGAALVYAGAGTENKLLAAARDIVRHRDAFAEYYEKGGRLLFTGASAALPLEGIEGLDGGVTPALGLVPGRAKLDARRRYTELIARCGMTDKAVTGAFNSSMYIEADAAPFLTVEFDSDGAVGETEGYVSAGLTATQLAAPLLVRNPALLDAYAFALAGRELCDPAERWYTEDWFGYVCALDILKAAARKKKK